MNTRIYDIVDELTEPLHHWTWYQLNGTSAHNNYIIQKEEWKKQQLAKELKKLLLEEEMKEKDPTNIQFTIRSEVR